MKKVILTNVMETAASINIQMQVNAEELAALKAIQAAARAIQAAARAI